MLNRFLPPAADCYQNGHFSKKVPAADNLLGVQIVSLG